jgi:CRISPR-associated protein Csy3
MVIAPPLKPNTNSTLNKKEDIFMANENLKTASVLAFERKLDPSDALFYSGDWNNRDNHENWAAVAIQEKSVRGTISNRLKTKDQDPAKLDAAIENPNLQTVDVASLPANADTLKVAFTLRILPGTGKPSACNDSGYQAKLLQTVESYVNSNGFSALAKRYAANLANGRFLWRNRVGAEAVETQIAQLRDGKAAQRWTFDALSLSLRDFNSDAADLAALANAINDGLAGKQHVLLQIVAFVRIGAGQEVFPSQELILERGRGDKSKTLYHVNKVAAIHSQKIGNALRTIDTWYEGAGEFGPIAVEPYGSVTTQGKAYRQPKQKMDFYNLLDNWVLKDKVPELDQQHFVMATLIRGGVFGDAG